MINILYTLLGLTLLASSAGSASRSVSPIMARAASPQAIEWADSVYAGLSMEQRVAQLFVPRIDISDNSAGRQQLTRMVDAGIGGFLLGKGTTQEYRNLIRLARSHAPVPLLVTLDGEWGPAMRLTDAKRYPYNMALGAIQDPALLYDYGLATARECRELGVNVDFSPVLDVNSNPRNPVIGYRSFGENPGRVSVLGTAYARGLEAGGVMSVAKHFPGHGDTSTDSHKTLPAVESPLSRLEKVELRPFADYINQGLSGVMVGHLRVPALDKSGAPASMSHKITTELLRNDMNFGGLVWTDALAMKGADSAENNCVRALQAGADLLLGSGAPLSDIKAVCAAINTGRIKEPVLRERCLKVLRYKYALLVDPVTPAATPDLQAVHSALAAASITCLKNENALIPVTDFRHRTVAVVSLGAKARNPFEDDCRRYTDVITVAAPSGQLNKEQTDKVQGADVIVVGLFKSNDAARISLKALAGHKPLVLVSFLNPYKLSILETTLPRCQAIISAGDDTPELQRAGAQAVFGGINVDGRMPVSVEGVCREGDGMRITRSRLAFGSTRTDRPATALGEAIDSLIHRCIEAGAFPGCQVLVAKDGDVLFEKAYGVTTRGSGGVPVTPRTLYDLASVTKATATTAAIMSAVDQDLMGLDEPLSRYIEELDTLPLGSVSIRQLLTHHSGLPSGLNIARLVADTASYEGALTSSRRTGPYQIEIDAGVWANRDARTRADLTSCEPSERFDQRIADHLYVGTQTSDTIMSRIYSLVPGSPSYRYSDLNYCLLARALENVAGETIDQFVESEVFDRIGMDRSVYCAADYFEADEIAPTETDRFLRRSVLHGYVHDETASFSGGVQGNAGLFAPAADVAKLCQMWLNGGEYGERVLSESVIGEFISPDAVSSDGKRFPGFDRLNGIDGWSSASFGHTGFTGTCFWVDPVTGIIVVFLSNRVCPARNNPAFKANDPRRPLLKIVGRYLG